jgi:hypothetical protein
MCISACCYSEIENDQLFRITGGTSMSRGLRILGITVFFTFLVACATSYKVKPLPFRAAASYANATEVAGATVGAKAFVSANEAKQAFGFDVRGAGMLPVQVVFDNQGFHPLEINAVQTFLEDSEGNLWPVLASKTAYERATKYSQTKQIFKEGAYSGFLGATAGALIGAAVGVVTGENVGSAAGKGAAVGAAAGATLGGVKGYTSDDPRYAIIEDLQEKSLENRAVQPQSLAHGFIFFPGEAKSAKQLRMQLVEVDTGTVHVLKLNL